MELVVSLAILLIVSAIAIPSIMRTLQFYQLNDGASRLAGMVKYARFEAIRRNKVVPFQFQQSGANWIAWADSTVNGTPDPNEAQTVLSANVGLTGAAPGPAVIATQMNVPALTVISGAPNLICFDQRGAVTNGNLANPPIAACGASVCPASVCALYIGNPADPTSGYRAVVVLPSGATEVWAASAAGDWHRTN